MEFGAKNLAVVHHLSALSALENERGRSRSIGYRDMAEEELICPKPRPAVIGVCAGTIDVSKPLRKLRGHTSLPAEGEAGHEILDILFSKVSSGDGSSGSPIRYFFGSPPSRANNPLIHDVHFTQGRAPVAPPQKSPRNSSLGSSNSASKSPFGCSYGSKPFVRIEGFVSSSPDSQQGVPTCA